MKNTSEKLGQILAGVIVIGAIAVVVILFIRLIRWLIFGY